MTTTLKKLTWDQIHASPNNLRKDVGDIGDLAESIAGIGLIQPMVVRKNEDGYELIAGERRWTAIGMLIRDKRVEADRVWDTLVRNDVDDPEQTAAMIVENLHRAGLTPVEELAGILRLQNQYSWTPKEIAVATGIPESTVKSRLKWAKLPDHVVNAIGSNLSVGDANKLASFSAEGVAKLTKGTKVPSTYDISEFDRAAEKERNLKRLRTLLERNGHIVVNKTEWQILVNPNVGTHDAKLQPARDKLMAMRQVCEANEGFEISAKWLTTTNKEELDTYLVDTPAGEIFQLDAAYSVQLYHMRVEAPTEADDSEEELTDWDRANDAARAEYDKAREQWDGQRIDAITEFLAGKPADVVLWVLGKALAREHYMVEKDDADLRRLLGLDATDPTLEIFARKSAANMAKVIAGAGFMQRYNDPPNCPPRPEMVDVDEDAYDEDGKFIPEDQRGPKPCACGDPTDPEREHFEDECLFVGDDEGTKDYESPTITELGDISEYDPQADVDEAIDEAIDV